MTLSNVQVAKSILQNAWNLVFNHYLKHSFSTCYMVCHECEILSVNNVTSIAVVTAHLQKLPNKVVCWGGLTVMSNEANRLLLCTRHCSGDLSNCHWLVVVHKACLSACNVTVLSLVYHLQNLHSNLLTDCNLFLLYISDMWASAKGRWRTLGVAWP